MNVRELRVVVEEIARVALEREDISKYIGRELDLADWYLDQVYKILEEKTKEVEVEDEDTDTWIAKHRERVDAFYAKGLDFKPDPECSACDVHNDYICFEHELEQLRESEFEKEVKLYDEEGNYMGMMGGHEVRK